MDRIYLDHASTTPVSPEVLEAMLPWFSVDGFNPSGLYLESRRARAGLDRARELVADELECEPGDVVFTGSGSEGANLAIKGAAIAARERGRNVVITSAIEHHCVLGAVEYLQRHAGFEVRIVKVDDQGLIKPQALATVLGDDVAVVSLMYANNEIGVIADIPALAAQAHAAGAIFHTDAVQAIASCEARVDELGVDLLSIAAHKFYGPKGVGALYVRPGTRVVPQIQGGGQENRRRAGTENVALATGLATGLRLARSERTANRSFDMGLQKQIRAGLAEIGGIIFNGHPDQRLANNTNVCIEGVRAEQVLLELDRAGFAASSGSACTVASVEPSHVLLALGLSPQIARASLRITTGKGNDAGQVDRFLTVLAGIIERLRARGTAPVIDNRFAGRNLNG